MSMDNKNDKRAFDPTVNFSFFGSWMNSIEAIEQASGAEAAYMLFKAIAYYSMYDEQPDFSNAPIMYAIWAIIEREIDISIGKRKRNFASDEMDENIQKVKAAIIENPNASVRDIEKMTGVGKSTVDRIKHKYKEEIEFACTVGRDSTNDSDSVSGSDIESVFDSNSVSDYDSVSDSDNDTMGRDRDGTVGQFNPEDYLSNEKDRVLYRLERVRQRLSNPEILKMEFFESGEHLGRAMSVRGRWKYAYKAWQKSISNNAIDSILDKYLSTHEESPTLKRIGDKYGRIIDGWDNERQEPRIIYSVNGYFMQGVRHNIKGIPVDYYSSSESRAEIEEEKIVFEDWLQEHDILFDDLPF